MRPQTLLSVLAALTEGKHPTFIWGPPGIGKSDLVREVAASKFNGNLLDLRSVLLDPTDVKGIPWVKDGVARWMIPDYFPQDPLWEGILFLDELPQAASMVQAALLQLILDRRLGSYRLPDGCAVIAAGNRTTDRAGTHKMITPLLNRFTHVDLEVHLEDWDHWASEHSIHPLIRGFMQFSPKALFDFNPKADMKTFASPRSWHRLSLILKQDLPSHTIYDVTKGTVGETHTPSFIAFMETYSKLPDIQSILDNPESAAVPAEGSVRWALAANLSSRASSLDDKHAAKGVLAIARYAVRLPKEFTAFVMRDLWHFRKDICMSSDFTRQWVRDNAKIIKGD